ncbi:MAG: riboflavin synthase [Bacteroidia bacterium]
MFTGIIETLGKVAELKHSKTNLDIFIQSSITHELKIDQSISHNGVCLTVVEINADVYRVTAIDETLKRSNLGNLKTGDAINLERCMMMNGRIDGHIVQGHVDCKATCKNIIDKNGSWEFYFEYDSNPQHITVEKGSVCVNGISLTVVESKNNLFSVAIIPYTFENTNFNNLKVGDEVNIEFDIIGKYVAKMMEMRS